MFALERDIVRTVNDYKEGRTGKLRIAATYLPANFLLPQWIAAYKSKHEDVQVIVHTANTREAMHKLTHYEADIAVIGGGVQPEQGVCRQILFEDPMWFVVQRDHRFAGQEVSLADIAREPFILREEGSRTRDMLIALCRAANVKPPEAQIQWNGIYEAVRAVKSGLGVIFASSAEVRDDVARGDVARVRVRQAEAVNPIAVCYRENEALTKQAAAFLEVMGEAASGHLSG